MAYEKQIEAIRACSKALLSQGKVDRVLGYTAGGLEGASIPFFARTPEDADKLVWGDRCVQNLATYLHGRKDRVGIVAKPCDVRAIIQYINERQVNREQVYIIGVDCGGMVDAEGNSRAGCGECRVRIPPLFDTHVADSRVRQNENVRPEPEEDLAGSLEKFQREIDKCILCYACRQACSGCYCPTCFIERDTPNWLPSEVDTGAKMTFHLGRAMHLAGRCVECGACESVCASGVNLRYLFSEIAKFVEDAYDFRAGMTLDVTPPLAAYGSNDKEIGFLGGEA